MNMDLQKIAKKTTKSSTNGTTISKIKYRDKIRFEKSMLLASLPVLYDEINMMENFLSKEELTKIKQLLIYHESLLK